jgi:hypothetical protein
MSYTNETIKAARLHGISINPALNDGLIRIEANQWVLDERGNVMDIKHRLEAKDIYAGLTELFDRAYKIVKEFHKGKPTKTPNEK